MKVKQFKFALATCYSLLATFFMPVSGQTKEVLYYVCDINGTPVAMTNEQGNVVWRGSALPFGEDFGGTGTRDTEIGYCGKPYNHNIGLYDLGSRYYDPNTGRFTSVDPVMGDLQNPQGLNSYAYGLNSPYKYVDPNGKDPRKIYEFTTVGAAFGGYGAVVGFTIGVGVYYYILYQNDPEFQATVKSAVTNVGNTFAPNTVSSVTSETETDGKDRILETSNKKLTEASENDEGKQDKKLSPGEIKKLQKGGIDPEELKDRTGGRDLYKNRNGDIIIKPKGGKGPGEPTGINIKDF